MQPQPAFLNLPDGRRIAYHKSSGTGPCVVFMGGFKSDMTGSKSISLENYCTSRGQAFLRFDYTGHGQSSGTFEQGTISHWRQDALDVLDALAGENCLIVGSSMGAWLALLSALTRKDKVVGMVGIASAPDFTENLIWQKINDQQKQALLEQGVFYAPSCYGEEPYPITRALIEDGRNHLLLNSDIPLTVPVRLLHGTQDEDVPWQTSITLMERLHSADVRVKLLKGGNHRLSDPVQLKLLCDTVGEMLG